ncbi:MAG: hypothetical protein HXX11_06255 [Desulfuromonadales bacterium]|nr:hypothetical protein [Desulfuromonadales bacterium]
MTFSTAIRETNPITKKLAKPKPERWFSMAKICHPKTSGVFPRQRLFRVLDKCRESPAIWVSAPAGSGKTTLIASYLSDRKLDSIWYRVDGGDGDIATFFYYMGLAAKKAAPGRHAPLPLLTPEYLQGITTFTLRYFENLYSRLKPPFAVVFDNYQHVQAQSSFHEVICNGLDSLPDGINVILISREAPPPQFVRMRVNRKLTLLEGEEIHFNLDESAELIRIKGLQGLSWPTISWIHERTRGWAAGLVVMTENTKGDKITDQIHSGNTPKEIFDYFATEIFDKADREKQEFLLKTSLLPCVTVRIAERITGNVQSGEILSNLHRSHFFTERDTDSNPVFRFHPLFREFLLSKASRTLPREETARIQQNAAALFMETGHPEEAAAFFLDAGEWGGFVPFLLDQAPVLIAQGRIRTLEEWLAHIPLELVSATPWLIYWSGICRMGINPAAARSDFEKAFNAFSEQRNDAGTLLSWSGVIETVFCEFDDFTQLDPWIDWLEQRMQRETLFPSARIESAVSSSMAGALLWRRSHHTGIWNWVDRALSLSKESEDTGLRLQAFRRALNCYAWYGNHAPAGPVLAELEKMGGTRSAHPVVLITVKMICAHYSGWSCDSYIKTLRLVSDGLALSRETGAHTVDFLLLVHGVYGALVKGDEILATGYLGELKRLASPDRRAAYCLYLNIMSLYHLFIEKFPDALKYAEQAVTMAERSGIPYIEAIFRFVTAQAAHEAGDIGKAREEQARGASYFINVESPQCRFLGHLVKAYIAYREGNDSEGGAALGLAMKLGRQYDYSGVPLLWRPKVWSLLCARALGAGIEVEYVHDLIRKQRLDLYELAADCENWPWPVKIYTLGRFELFIDGNRLEFSAKAPRRIMSFLKLLIACGEGGANEEQLTEIFWPDSDGDAAHNAFAISLHRLRKLLGSEKALQLRDGVLKFDPGFCWIDAHAFENLIDAEAGETAPTAERLTEKALSLYRGQYLEASGEPWAILYRERLRTRYLRAVRIQGEYLEAGENFGPAVELYCKGLEIEPTAEELYRRLMKCHLTAGQTSEAIAVYERCRTMLQTAMGIRPSRETEDIYHSTAVRLIVE